MLIILLSLLMTAADPYLIDFGQGKENSWYTVNDTVMGGRSSGTAGYGEDVLVFKGSVSFENNGGFASVRSEYNEMDLSSFSQVTIRYRCEGQSLNFTMDHYQQWYLPNYKAVLPATGMEWKTETFRLDSFREFRVGRPTGKMIPDEVLSRIIRFGIMTNDKKEGPFQAEIDFIRFE